MNYKQEITEDIQEMITTIGKEVKETREKKNWSQQRLAEELGCTVKYVKRIEQGDVHFRLNLMTELSYTLEINLFEHLNRAMQRRVI